VSGSLPGTNSVAPLVDFNVTQPRKTTLFVLQGTGSEPEFLEPFVNALMDEYLNYKKEVRSLSSDDTVASLTEQLYKQEKELQAAQEKLHDFQRGNNTVVLQEEGVSAGNYLTRLNLQLADLRLEYQLLDLLAGGQVMPLLQRFSGGTGLLDQKQLAELPPSATSGDYQTARQQVELLKLRREELSRCLRPKHPRIVKLNEDITRAEKLLEIFRRQSREEISTARDNLKLRIQSVEESVKNWETKVLDANRRTADFDRFKMNVQRSQSLYDRLLQLVQNVDVNKNLDQETVAVLDRATVAPVNPRWPLKVALALAIGLIVGAGIVLYLERSDDRLTSVAELREQLEEKIIGQVPDVTGGRKGVPLRLVEPDDDRHGFLESFRHVRSSLMCLPRHGERSRVLLITSSVPGEGKSLIAANLARALAFTGSRVLLTDGDLRRGCLHRWMDVPDRPGLSEALQQHCPIEEVIVPTQLPNLHFIPAGRPSPRASELFLSERFDGLLNRVAADYDFVLLDSAPVFAAADTATLAPRTDGVLFVARRSFTRVGAMRQALEQLRERGANVLGLIFNRADPAGRHYYFYKYDGYGGVMVTAA
jgi:capsular exopolysaccharide synthesis family protein